METEDQQVEQIKAFWKEHGKGIVAGLVIGFALFYGWRYYDAQTLAKQEAQSENYEQVVAQLEADGAEALSTAQNFMQEASGSTYGTLAAFEVARKAATAGDLAAAIGALENAQANAEGALKHVASLRLARLQMAQENYQAALTALDSIAQVEGFKAKAAELRGDVLMAQGDAEGARDAYESAIAAAAEAGVPTVLVETKLNSIPAAS
jgi:predicted negative regulator of RcsB-dependent stress response